MNVIPAAFPIESILEIIVAIALIIIAMKLIKTITKPLFITIVVVAALLVIFGVVDLATFAATGEKVINNFLTCAGDAANNAVSGTDVGNFIKSTR